MTGETVESGKAFIAQITDSIVNSVHDANSLRAWIIAHRSTIDRNPAAFCAVEIAVLDLIGRIKTCPVEDLVGVPRLTGRFQYSAVLGDAPYLAYWWQYRRYWNQGFRDFKIKLSGDPRRDCRKIGLFRNKAYPPLRVRLDANNFWSSADACIRHIKGLSYDVFAIEEPLHEGDLAGFERVRQACGVKIILDESLSRIDQLDWLDETRGWIVNLRVSKMGGIIRSLDVAEKASHLGIGVIVGAQVGETSLLTRAALTVMNANRANLVASEGAFGTHLLRHDLASPSLMFGAGGLLDTEKFDLGSCVGLGLQVRYENLAPMA